jgi:hypothetical protein
MKKWEEHEVTYLQDRWGTVSISGIAKKLERSVNSIKMKARHLGLGNMLDCGDYITFKQFMQAFNKTNCYKAYLKSWVKNRGFPLKYKQIIKKQVMIVYLDDFWLWAEKNRDFVNFSNMEENIFGKEPTWVKKQRKADAAKKDRYKNSKWTPFEDEKLKHYLKQFRYTCDELSKMIGRTCCAIQKRIYTLGLRERPIKADDHTNPWEEADIKVLHQSIKEGLSYELMSEYIGRSSKAIRGKVYELYNTERLDAVRNVI